MRCTNLLALALLVFGLTGCGDQGIGDAGATAGAGESQPSQTVFSFLKAVQMGNDEQAGQLLTNLARQKTAELDMVVAPPGSDTATFKIGQEEMLGGDSAQVASSWTDVDQDGQARTDHITWILKREVEGWRIAGMSTLVFADQAPIVLNFEDPADMLEKQKLAEEEAIRRANAQSQQAQNPFQADRR